MEHSSRALATAAYTAVIGLDLSDKTAAFVELAADPAVAEIVAQGVIPLTEDRLRQQFGGDLPCRIALEVGPHSPWVSRLLAGLGHEVIIANPRQVALIAQSRRKTDRADAETLARLARVDPALLRPIRHRGATQQADLEQIRARDLLVRLRAQAINHVRGTVKAMGARLPLCSAESFARTAAVAVPEDLRPALTPIIEAVGRLTAQIQASDRAIADLAATHYPQTAALTQVPGVGTLTALTYVLTLDDARRFPHSRTVGPYLGLTPRLAQSGEQRPELGLSKAGDPHLRRLLVQCAHYILGPFGPDSELRRWGLSLAGAGSRQRKKQAVAAVARKLAVLLHHLWVSGATYDPFHHAHQRERADQSTDASSTATPEPLSVS